MSTDKVSRKKFKVEGFLRLAYDKSDRLCVSMKYDEHDDPEWQLVSHMKSELDPKVFDKFMKPHKM